MTKPRRRQAGEGAIIEYQTKAGVRYAIKYRVPQEDGSDRQVLLRKTRVGEPMTTRKQAADELRVILSELSHGTHVTPQKITVEERFTQWVDGLRIADSTRASYKKNLRLHVFPYIGSVQLAKLTTARLNVLYRQLEKSGRQDHKAGTGLSLRTVRYVATVVKAGLQAAVDQNVIARNPADRANPPTAKEARPPEFVPWSAEQLPAFLEWADEQGRPDATAWRVLAFSGARRGEVLAARWRDFDAGTGKLSIRRSLGLVRTKGEGYELKEGPTKTGKPRVVKLDRRTVEVLRRYRTARAGLDLRLVRPDALIFGTIDGAHQHPERFSRRFNEAVARCRRELGDDLLPAVRLHDLRHGWATMALRAGVHPKVVQERLGHASISVTLGVYSHVLEEMDEDAAEKVATVAWGAES
jgi:integrase